MIVMCNCVSDFLYSIHTHTGEVVVEDGAEWIHGDRRNPLHRLARSLGALDQPLSDDAWGKHDYAGHCTEKLGTLCARP